MPCATCCTSSAPRLFLFSMGRAGRSRFSHFTSLMKLLRYHARRRQLQAARFALLPQSEVASSLILYPSYGRQEATSRHDDGHSAFADHTPISHHQPSGRFFSASYDLETCYAANRPRYFSHIAYIYRRAELTFSITMPYAWRHTRSRRRFHIFSQPLSRGRSPPIA